jgi:hypothetical protein
MRAHDNIVPLHRGVRPIPVRDLQAIFQPRESWSHAPIRDCSKSESSWIGWGVLFALIAVGFAHWGAW